MMRVANILYFSGIVLFSIVMVVGNLPSPALAQSTPAAHLPFAKVQTAKRLYRKTSLVQDKQVHSAIVAPSQGEFPDLALRIQRAIRDRSGVEIPIWKAENARPADLHQTNAVFLGNVCNNPAMQELYGLLYTPLDDAYPLDDGYLVHTVHDPWGTAHNALVVGAASAKGTQRAVAALLSALPKGPDIVLPKLNLYDLGKREMQQAGEQAKRLTDADIRSEVENARQAFARGRCRDVARQMGNLGFLYSRTGLDRLAILYKELAVAWDQIHSTNPATCGGPWGMDMDFHLMQILPAWDMLEQSPLLTDDDRLQVAKILFEFTNTTVVPEASGALRSKSVRFNHTTFPALGLFYAGRYFQHGYGNIEADRWLEIARECFTLQAQAAKPNEDCNSYGWYVPYHTMRYALATLDPTYFTNGNARIEADYAIDTMNNLGYQVPYGDTGEYQCGFREVPLLRGATYAYRDGRYAWALDKKSAARVWDWTKSPAPVPVKESEAHAFPDPYSYTCNVEPKEPTDLLGCRAIPLDKPYWESFDGPKSIPLEKAVDKVVMRASFDSQRQYLLLDGLSNGGHKHFDGNSILQITDRNRIWLADNDYIRSLPRFHNSVLVFKDGQTATLPPYCELQAVADGPQHGISQTVVRNYAGADWQRTILWSKERFFLVLDDLVAQEPGEFDFHCVWHTLGEAQLTPDGLEVEQQGPRFSIHVPRDVPVQTHLSNDAEQGKNWLDYPFAAPVVRRLREVRSANLTKGEDVTFANLLYCSESAKPQKYALKALDDCTFLVSSAQETFLAGIGDCDLPRDVGPEFRLAAGAFLIGQEQGLVARVRLLRWRNRGLDSNRPLTVQWSADHLVLTASEPATVLLTAGSQTPHLAGKATLAKESGRWRLKLPVGSTAVDLPGEPLLTGLATRASQWPSKSFAHQAPTQSSKGPEANVQWSFQPPADTTAGNSRAAKAGQPTPLKNAPRHETILTTAAGDLDGDGRDEILAGSDKNHFWCLSATGRPLWSFTANGAVTTAAVAKLDDGPHRCAVLGSEDCSVYALSADGTLRWKFAMPDYKQPGRIRVLLAADINADGYDEVIAGGDNWRYYALDRQGRELWHYESVHPSTAAAVADLDGDGKLETLCGTAYYWWHCAGSDGAKRWSYSVRGPHATVVLAANFYGDKTRAALFGGEDGLVHALNGRGKLLWQVSVGDEVSGAVAIDLHNDGHQEVVASSKNSWLFAIDGDGITLWRKNLGEPMMGLLAADVLGQGHPQLVAGGEEGNLLVLDRQGTIAAHWHAPAEIAGLTAARLSKDGRTAIIVRCADGTLTAVRW